MKQIAQEMPSANLAINKSRIKVYNKKSELPTYYLKKGQEFQIELFNPTTKTILARISLNNTPIAQGGLVLRPGERAFLDRYIDVAKKFKFDTYEVGNSNSVQNAIRENGDFKVEFFLEFPPVPQITLNTSNGWSTGNFNQATRGLSVPYNTSSPIYGASSNYSSDINTTNLSNSMPISDVHDGEATLDFMEQELSRDFAPSTPLKTDRDPNRDPNRDPRRRLKSKRSKMSNTIETGRVEAGSESEQQLTTVQKSWSAFAFHTIEYKMLPISQKVNTTQDIMVKRYCAQCGGKQKSNYKFCPSCGAKA